MTSENRRPEENLADEFRQLGKNLTEALRAAWESPERRRLQQEIESGLNTLGATIREEVDTLSQSPTGQKIKNEAEDVRQRIRSGEAEAKLREELVNALRMVNTELQKVAKSWSGTPDPEEKKSKGGEQQDLGKHELHPDDVDSTSPEPERTELTPDDVETGSKTPSSGQ